MAFLLQNIQVKGQYLNGDSKNDLKIICFLLQVNSTVNLLNALAF